jgi:serine/threonine-protein kinase HipA
MHSLEVFLNDTFVGMLRIDENGTYRFDYATEYDGFAISPHIVPHRPASSRTVKNFLENLLPEGKTLEEIAGFTKISKNNFFALIRAVGFESSGALRFGRLDKNEPIFREISEKELARRIDDIQNEPITIWDGKIRFSLAGMQDKLPVFFDGNTFGLADGSLSSTHILKFDTDRFGYITLNEFYCMRLAEKVGLNAAATSLMRVGEHYILVVKRFDRIVRENGIERLHIIDGCQMLNLPSSYKYERNFGSGRDVKEIREGVSFAKLFKAAERLKVPAVAKLTLLRWALFNLIIANADAHGKNISFFVDKYGLEIAPFYDLLNISMYAHIDHSLAMAFGDEFDADNVLAFDLVDFAHRIGLPKQLVAKELKRLARNVAEHSDIAFDIALSEDALRFVTALKEAVSKRAEKYVRIADEMNDVSY